MRITHQSKSFCEMTKADGGRCQGRKIAGSSFCFFHDPLKSTEREAAQRAGGLKSQVAVLPGTAPDARLLDAHDIAKLIAATINQVRRGELDPKVANAVGYLGGLLMKAFHESEVEKRLGALEAAVKSPPGTPEFILDEDRFKRGDSSGSK